jgi:hypothetical protein
MRRILLITILVSLLLGISSGIAFAQNYSFSLDRETIHVYWNEDGTLSLSYEMVFTNDSNASPIDIVDVGLPTSDYRISNISASVDGVPIRDIEDSPYVTWGVALGLGSNAIQPGRTGTVYMEALDIGGVLYTDDDDENYASAVFSTSWIESSLVHGKTDLTVIYHLPPGVGSEEPRWHGSPSGWQSEPDTGFDDQGRVTYSWRNSGANGHTQYFFGASFPKLYVPEDTIAVPPSETAVNLPDGEGLIGLGFFCLLLGFIVGIPVLTVISNRNRKMHYLPPKIALEGHGIKRGLTAVESAILLEQPMDKILTMILFAVIKKGAATVTKRDPLTIEVADPLPENLRKYEKDFLIGFQESSIAKRRRALQKAMVNLIKSVGKKLKGFSRRETTDYYESIVKRAWSQVEAADTPEVKSDKYNEVMEWTMLDKDYDDRTREVFRHHPVFVPIWWNRYDPGYSRGVASAGPSKPALSRSGSPSVSLPNLPGSDFAASVVGGVQNFSAGVVGSISDFTGGVTKVTNPIPKSTYRGSGRSGGGSSCACACACAGCACACAGGGR